MSKKAAKTVPAAPSQEAPTIAGEWPELPTWRADMSPEEWERQGRENAEAFKRKMQSDQDAVEAEDRERARRAEAQRIADEIKHGVTPDKTTVPTQIRILQSQLDDLKVISGLERTNISSILRLLIAEYILAKREDPVVSQALDWAAGARRVAERTKAESAKGR